MVFDFEYLEKNDCARILAVANNSGSEDEAMLRHPQALDSSFSKPRKSSDDFISKLDYINWHSHSRRSIDSIDQWTYRRNLLMLCILWSASSYASYFMFFENKYLEGNIYVFFYYEGVTGVIASLCA